MICKKCGAQLQNDDTFCAVCGADCKSKEKEVVKRCEKVCESHKHQWCISNEIKDECNPLGILECYCEKCGITAECVREIEFKKDFKFSIFKKQKLTRVIKSYNTSSVILYECIKSKNGRHNLKSIGKQKYICSLCGEILKGDYHICMGDIENE